MILSGNIHGGLRFHRTTANQFSTFLVPVPYISHNASAFDNGVIMAYRYGVCMIIKTELCEDTRFESVRLCGGLSPFLQPHSPLIVQPEKTKPSICCMSMSNTLTEPLPHHRWAGQITAWFIGRPVTNPVCRGNLHSH